MEFVVGLDEIPQPDTGEPVGVGEELVLEAGGLLCLSLGCRRTAEYIEHLSPIDDLPQGLCDAHRKLGPRVQERTLSEDETPEILEQGLQIALE